MCMDGVPLTGEPLTFGSVTWRTALAEIARAKIPSAANTFLRMRAPLPLHGFAAPAREPLLPIGGRLQQACRG